MQEMQETWLWLLGQEDALEQEMAPTPEKATAPHSSTLARKIPRMEEPGRLQSMGSLRVRHDWVTSLSLFTFMHWRRKWQPLQCSCLENPRDGGAWWAAIYGVEQSRTRLKGLSSSSSSQCSCPENPMGRGAWRATVQGVTKSQTRPKQLSTAQHSTHTHKE